jgi:hypothetical protein
MLEVLKATDALMLPNFDPDYTEAIDALIAGEIDVVIVPQQDPTACSMRSAPRHPLMSVAQAEAIAKTVPAEAWCYGEASST